MLEIGLLRSTVVLAGAVEPLVLRAVQPEPLLLGAIRMLVPVALRPVHAAALLAPALPAFHGSVGAKAFSVSITARKHPIPAFMAEVY